MAGVTDIEDLLRERISRRINQFAPNSPELKKAMFRIGFLLESEIKLNVRRQRLIDTGRLLNSIRFNVKRKGNRHTLNVGSFGVPYAQVHEFGFKGVQQIREHRRLQKTAFGRKMDPPRNVRVREHPRKVSIIARPFMGPAIKKKGPRVTQILAELFEV